MNQYAEQHREVMKRAGQINHVASSNEFSQKMERLNQQMQVLGEGLTAAEQMNKQMKSFERNEFQQLKAIAELLNTTDMGEQMKPLYDNQLDAISTLFEAMGEATGSDRRLYVSDLDLGAPTVSDALVPSMADVQPAPREKGKSEIPSVEMFQELIDRGDMPFCPECETAYAPGNVQFYQTGEDSSSEYDVVCENCYGSDIGFQ